MGGASAFGTHGLQFPVFVMWLRHGRGGQHHEGDVLLCFSSEVVIPTDAWYFGQGVKHGLETYV